MTPLWSWPELCDALGLAVSDGPDVMGLCIDSRRARPGDLFIALPGDPGPRFNPSQRSDRDGHDYIDDALVRGAVAVLAHDGAARNAPQLQVADTLDALWQLGAAARARQSGAVVAVTGSSGKTTVKGLLAAALQAFAAPGSLNNHLGVPLSLAMTPRDAGAAVYEIGTNHPGEIAPLSTLARPDVAVVLNVHPAHRENFASMQALTREKLSICEGLPDGGNLVVEDAVAADGLRGDLVVSRFGRSATARVRLLDATGSEAVYEIGGRRLTAHVPGGGVHRALSLAAVLCVLDVLGRDLTDACHLPDTLIAPGRGQLRRAGGVLVIDDSYNANPESLRAALVELAARPEVRRYALLGEMLELGAEGPAFHAALASGASGLDGVFCVGEGMRPLCEALPADAARYWCSDADDALLDRLADTLQPGDAILVKGSNRVFWAKDFANRLIARLGCE